MGDIVNFNRSPKFKPRRCISCGGYDIEHIDESEYAIVLAGVGADGKLDDYVYRCRDCGRLSIVVQPKEFTKLMGEIEDALQPGESLSDGLKRLVGDTQNYAYLKR